MASIDELKRQIDLHDLAEKLGLERPGGRGNYKSPHHADKSPSLRIDRDGQRWNDYSSDDPVSRGSCVDLVMYVEGIDDVGDAIRRLHEIYGIEASPPRSAGAAPRQHSIPEYIAEQCATDPDPVYDYLTGRGISSDAIGRAIKRGTLGWNTYTSPKVPAGVAGHLGPGAAFVVRTLNPGRVVAVDERFADPELNGGVKTWTHGEKYGYPWTSDWRLVERSPTVYIVESPINALSIDTLERAGWAAVATRGTDTVNTIDWRFLRGKRVVVCLDNDPPNDKGVSPGHRAAWQLHETLTSLGVAVHLVDQNGWDGSDGPVYNDVNDLLQEDATALRGYLSRLEPWVIPGQPALRSEERKAFRRTQKPRIWLPPHDYGQYARFRCKEDFTTYVKKWGDDEDDKPPEFGDLCGFRVASLSRVQVQSATATMAGEADAQPTTLFAVSVQMPRHGNRLVRRVFEDERLHNVDQWQKFGPIYARSQFQRMINILERGADIGAREAVNFIGLAWKQGRPVVNEAPDCYFTEPEKQCPYHALTFPSGPTANARRVVEAYRRMFRRNAGLNLLVWALGGHLKLFLGFWPHMMLQADKGAGKSTLVKQLERSIAMTMFSGQSLQTEFRLLTSTSHTSHPVGWEEISARRVDVIDKAVSLLQESYQYTVTRRGPDLTEFLVSAPVLLAGEDVPVRSLTGKLVRAELTGRKGDLPPDDLPPFPLREWLQHLATHSRAQVASVYRVALEEAREVSRATGEDDGATRMVGNYAALLCTWSLLAEWLDLPYDYADIPASIHAEMNDHIAQTSGDREPWVWILETLLDEISSGNYRHPHKIQLVGTEECLVLRTSHVMHHFRTTLALRQIYDALPVKSDRVLKRQLQQAGVIHDDRVDVRIQKHREHHMTALSLRRLEEYGLHVSRPEDTGDLMPE